MDAAANINFIEADASPNVLAVVAALRVGKMFPPPTAVESRAGDFVTPEGYRRSTSYTIFGPGKPVDFTIGRCPGLIR